MTPKINVGFQFILSSPPGYNPHDDRLTTSSTRTLRYLMRLTYNGNEGSSQDQEQ